MLKEGRLMKARLGLSLGLAVAGIVWMGAAAAPVGSGGAPAGVDVLHPPKLSLELKDATLGEVAAALNKQLGGEYVRADGGARGAAAPRVTLKAQAQPLWEILRQVHGQVPLAFSAPGDEGVETRTGMIGLRPPSGRTRPQPVYVTDGVCTVPLPAGDPATGNWELRCWVYTDPRVRLTYHMSALRVDKAIDQDGRALAGLPTLSARTLAGMSPRPMAYATAAFAAAPGLKAIKELRGSLAVEVLESTDTVKIDLTKPQNEPIATEVGKFTVEKGAGGEFTVKLEPAAGTGAGRADRPVDRSPGSVLEMRMIDNTGAVQSVPTGSGRQSWTVRVSNRARSAASLEIVLCLKTREGELPVVFKDLEVPANTVAPLQGGR
jgi:hypothetical protein